jgi:hypothetical protein
MKGNNDTSKRDHSPAKSGALLSRAIESAKHAGQDLEIIVVDDASTDETAAICRELRDIIICRWNATSAWPELATPALERVAGNTSRFLMMMICVFPHQSIDKPIYWHKMKVRVSFMVKCISEIQKPAPTGEVRPRRCPTGDIFWQLVQGNFIYVPSVLVRRRLFEAIGLFAQDVPGTEDWDAWLRLSAVSRVEAVHEPVGIYRDFSPGQMSANRPKMLSSSARTQAKALRSPRASIIYQDTRRQARSEYLNAIWQGLLDEGKRSFSDWTFITQP